jgi:hypothetical protein
MKRKDAEEIIQFSRDVGSHYAEFIITGDNRFLDKLHAEESKLKQKLESLITDDKDEQLNN